MPISREPAMERVEIYGWTVHDQQGWRAIAVAVRASAGGKHRRLERPAGSADEALETLVKLSAALATMCKRRGKRVLLRMFEHAPAGL